MINFERLFLFNKKQTILLLSVFYLFGGTNRYNYDLAIDSKNGYYEPTITKEFKAKNDSSVVTLTIMEIII